MSATTAAKRGKKFKDVPAKDDAAFASTNVFGVVTSGFETVRILLPKTSRCEAEIRLARLADGWRYGHDLRRLLGGQSGGPSKDSTAYRSRDEALAAGANHARDFFVEAASRSERSEPAEAYRCKQALNAVQAFIDGLPKADPSEVDVDAPLQGEIDLRDDEPDSPAAQRVTKAALAPPGRELPKPLGKSVMLSLAALERHPANRQPAAADIEERAKSLAADGQLEDVVARALPAARYQIISGETRTLAARSLGWSEVRCTVIECDDAEALRLVALYNGQRSDLNPIQKAQLLEAFGQAGLSREEAARCVGLESGSAASNLVRLLKLPKVWQDRVAAGELAESWARALLPIVPIDAALKEAEREFQSPPQTKWQSWGFESRQAVEELAGELLERHTRRLDDTKRHYGGDYQKELGGWEAMGEYPCLLHADEIAANRAKLKIVTIVDGGKEVEVATNCKLFDELQCAIIKQRHEAKAKKKAAAAGKSAERGERVAGAERVKSAAELKQDAENRARQLQRSIDDWRERLLRFTVADAIIAAKPPKSPDPRLLKLLLHFLCETGALRNGDLLERLQAAVGGGKRVKGGVVDGYSLLTPHFAADPKAIVAWWHKVAAELCAYLIAGDADESWEVELWPETLQALFDEWGCDLTAAWRQLHAAKDPRLEEFFELHRKDELRALAQEVTPELHLAESLGKPQMLKLILGRTRPPELPKCLQPAKKPEAKANGKRGGK